MPYRWIKPDTSPGIRESRLLLWPNRSLPNVGFAWTIGLAAGLPAIPLIGLLGTTALWALLPFLLIPVAGLWVAIRRNDRDGLLREELVVARGIVTLTRTEPDGGRRHWKANPFHVRVDVSDGPVDCYLTLRGGGRVVELGAFLSKAEREALKPSLEDELRAASGFHPAAHPR